MTIEEIVNNQREYYMTGVTRPLEYRLAALRKLQQALRDYGDQISDALLQDLNKQPFESHMAEIGMVLDEVIVITHLIGKRLKHRIFEVAHTYVRGDALEGWNIRLDWPPNIDFSFHISLLSYV